MKKRTIGLVASALGSAVAAWGGYRLLHPAEAKGPVTPDPGRDRQPLDDALFDLPDGVTSRFLPTPDGGAIHLLEKGEGRPLVLLHGITLRSDVWAPQFHQLADRYRVIAVDLRGHGQSEPGTDGFGIKVLADDLATLLAGLELRDAIVVGHSMGGMTTMQFAGDYPEVLAERVAGIMLIATRAHQVFPPFVDQLARNLVHRGQGIVDAGRELPRQTRVNDRMARLAFGERPSRKAVSLVTQMGASQQPAHFLASAAGLIEHDAREGLRRTKIPTVVVVGTRDSLTPVPSGRHLARLIEGAEFVVLPRAGHQLMQERPDELAELIDALAARINGAADSVAEAVEESEGSISSAQVEDPGDLPER